MSSAIAVLGCGWLGLPLAEKLIEQGYKVLGSTTDEKKIDVLKKARIIAFKIILGEDKIEGPIDDFLGLADTLIINVPPNLRGENKENYVQKMRLLLVEILRFKIKKIIFISSTSVYGKNQGEVTEETIPEPVTASGRQLLEVEQLFKNEKRFQLAIIRFGGLIGPDRHPVTFLSGKENLKNGNDPVNLIHLNDCIAMILFIINNKLWNETYNGVYPDHPKKAEYYTKEAQKRGLPGPKYVLNKPKIRGNQIKSRNFLNKKYRFSTPIS